MIFKTLQKPLLYLLIPFQLLIFALITPPFQKPDEDIHFMRALTVAKGVFFCPHDNNIVNIEKKYFDLYSDKDLVLSPRSTRDKINPHSYYSKLTRKYSSLEIVPISIDQICDFYFLPYIPQALGIIFGSLLFNNPYVIFFIGRVAMALLSYLWFLYLYKKSAKIIQSILLITFALPMTLHQVSSYSYDAMHIMLGLTFFCLLVKAIIAQKITSGYLVLLFFTTLLFGLTKKIGYELFAFLLLILPVKIISKDKKIYALKITLFIILLTTIWSMGKFSLINNNPHPYAKQAYNIVPSSNAAVQPQLQFIEITNNPLKFSQVLVNTTLLKAGFYLQGLIGIFGWLEYGLAPAAYVIYVILFFLILINNNLEKKYALGNYRLSVLFIFLIATYIYILTLSYLYWTALAASIVEGVQGRYFIVLVPFILFFLFNLKKYIIVRMQSTKLFGGYPKGIARSVRPALRSKMLIILLIYSSLLYLAYSSASIIIARYF